MYPWNSYSLPVAPSMYERTHPSSSDLPNPVYASVQPQSHQNVHEIIPSDYYYPAFSSNQSGINALPTDFSVYESYESSSDSPSPMESSVQPPAMREKILTIPGGPCLWEMGGRICMKWCQNPEEMSAHLNEVHIPRENNVVCYWTNCGQAGKPFKKRYAIVNHVRVHTRETPFQCDVCQKGFARAANLRIHGRTHTGDKPFLCPVDGCSKRCSNSSDRKRHIRSHWEGRPYDCKKHHEKSSSGTSGSEESLTDTSSHQSTESEHHNLVINPSYSQVEHSAFYDHRYQNDCYPSNYYEY
ncbi:hypothetical protein CAEBREN_14662 [Caenorhabditis brenneri]|uniref:C2H2-type domain-containing protein n=1 Tax=Caenorhabditis brenneri TaxID=135651 RepID=G0N2K3_CAEBE|nr:hypothetical protein CAEBREN_14662 [Caenorhabditis brenneri]